MTHKMTKEVTRLLLQYAHARTPIYGEQSFIIVHTKGKI